MLLLVLKNHPDGTFTHLRRISVKVFHTPILPHFGVSEKHGAVQCYNPALIMSTIALYQLLKRIPDVTENEVQAAVDSIPQVGEIATSTDLLKLEAALKADIHRLETKLVNLETRLTRLIFSSAAIVVVAISAITKLT